VGTNPEHIVTVPDSRGEPITWIGRDRLFERSPEPSADADPRSRLAVTLEASGVNRWKWTLGA